MFDFPDAITTSLEEELPPGIELVSDVVGRDPDSDYDDPVEENPAEAQPPVDVPMLPEKTVKAYVVNFTAYRTFVGEWRRLRYLLMDET